MSVWSVYIRCSMNHVLVCYTALGNLGGTLRLRKKFQPAEAVYRESLEIKERLYGRNHQETAKSKFALCCVVCGVVCMEGNQLLVDFVSTLV